MRQTHRNRSRGTSRAELRRPAAAAAAIALAAAAPAGAQQATWTPAPTQPSAGHLVTRFTLDLARFDAAPDDNGDRAEITDLRLRTTLSYGITGSLSATLVAPVVHRDADSDGPGPDPDEEFGLGDVTLSLKKRVWQNDFGPVDTARLALFAGAQLPTGEDAFSSDSVDPHLGATFMLISGRHGFNQALTWTFTTGDTNTPLRPGDTLSDALLFDSAYLYRLAPAEYGSDFVASWYAVAELNGPWETRGDTELILSPGAL